MRATLRALVGAITYLAAAHVCFAATIVVGQVVPLSGLDATEGRGYSAGIEMYFNQVNRAGGVNGNLLSLVRRDDAGRPDDTVAATRELLQVSKPLVLTGFIGNASVAKVVAAGILAREKIALVGYRSWEVEPATPGLFNIRAGLHEELGKFAEHLATIGVTRLGLFYEAGASEAELLSAAQSAARKAGQQILVQRSYPSGTARVSHAVEPFIKTAPQAIILIATGAAAAAFIEQYRSAGGTAQIFAHSAADVEQMAKRLSEDQLRGVAIAQVTPNPYRISTRVSKELNELVARSDNHDVPLSYAMMEGFITAKVIVEAIRRAGRVPTRESIAAAVESMDNFDVGGFVVGFKSRPHVGSRFVELSILSDSGKIRQ